MKVYSLALWDLFDGNGSIESRKTRGIFYVSVLYSHVQFFSTEHREISIFSFWLFWVFLIG